MASAIRLIRRSRASQVAPTDGQLGDRTRELGLVDAVAAFPPRRSAVHQPHPIEDTEMLGDRLAGDRQAVTERGRGPGAVGQQEVEHPAPGGIADRRPEVVVDGDLGRGGHRADTSRAT